MADRNLNAALKWSVEASAASQSSPGRKPETQLTSEMLAAVMGGPSQPLLMKKCVNDMEDEELDVATRITALEDLEFMVAQPDNANTMGQDRRFVDPLGTSQGKQENLWAPLLRLLGHQNPRFRELAAWCCATAVGNNLRTQEQLLKEGGIPTLARIAVEDPERLVRKKAILAISSAIRNFQLGLDAALPHIPAEYKSDEQTDTEDMESVNRLISKMRESLA